jgi:hypothetical protein
MGMGIEILNLFFLSAAAAGNETRLRFRRAGAFKRDILDLVIRGLVDSLTHKHLML